MGTAAGAMTYDREAHPNGRPLSLDARQTSGSRALEQGDVPLHHDGMVPPAAHAYVCMGGDSHRMPRQ